MSDSIHDRYCENVNSEPWTSACGCKERWQDAEITRLKELDEIGAKAHNANLLEMADMRATNRILLGYLKDAVNALESMPGTAEEWHKYTRWAEGLRKQTVERIKRELR